MKVQGDRQASSSLVMAKVQARLRRRCPFVCLRPTARPLLVLDRRVDGSSWHPHSNPGARSAQLFRRFIKVVWVGVRVFEHLSRCYCRGKVPKRLSHGTLADWHLLSQIESLVVDPIPNSLLNSRLSHVLSDFAIPCLRFRRHDASTPALWLFHREVESTPVRALLFPL